MSNACLHCYVSGRVQGVWFRANTQREAQRLKLTGWVKNLTDGRVEVFACGDEENLQQLQDWLWKGPPMAKVDNIEIIYSVCEKFDEFNVI